MHGDLRQSSLNSVNSTPHMVPEDKDSAYAVLWPLVDPLLKRERPPTKGKVRVAYFRRKCQRPRTTSARTSGVAQVKPVAARDGTIAHVT